MTLGEAGAPAPRWQIPVGFLSDTGRVRERNEDAYALYVPYTGEESRTGIDALFTVADGMGGHDAGDVASRFAARTAASAFDGSDGPLPEDLPDLGSWIERVFNRINRELREMAQSRSLPRGMGSTLTLAVLRGDTLYLGHVGDTRSYRLRGGILEQLTEDHSWVAEQHRAGLLTDEEAASHPNRNLLTRSLGMTADLQVFVRELGVEDGDRFLLCSDGLHGQLRPETLAAVLREEPDPQEAARRLVALADETGSPDNVTALVFDLRRVPTLEAPGEPSASGDAALRSTLPGQPARPRHGRSLARMAVAVALVAVVGAAAAVVLIDARPAALQGSRPASGKASPAPVGAHSLRDSTVSMPSRSSDPGGVLPTPHPEE